jgi:hypothetical protein
MIPANELRLGNYILYKQFGKGKGKIGEILPGDFTRIRSDDREESEYHPIPLTPEWLERCGLFENGSLYKGELRFKGCGHITIEVIENGGLGYFAPFNKTIEIKYLHQLQNLYFALTGDELKIEL